MSEKNSRVLAREWPYDRCNAFKEELRKAASEWFKKRKYRCHPSMPYCLPSYEGWRKNIICDDVVSLIDAERGVDHEKQLEEQQEDYRESGNGFPLHKYIHHGLSSQALAFNLVGPLFQRNDIEPLIQALADAGISWRDDDKTRCAIFEYEDRQTFNEDSGQPTSIDVVLYGSQTRVFIEVKLTESEFGGCSVFAAGDCEGKMPSHDDLGECYLHHINRKYWVLAKEHGLLQMPMFNGAICPFASYYQFYRELLFALAHDGAFVLLHDERNPAFMRIRKDGTGEPRGLWPLLTEGIPDHLKNRVGRITVQTLVKKIEASGRHDDWIGEFKKKYALKP